MYITGRIKSLFKRLNNSKFSSEKVFIKSFSVIMESIIEVQRNCHEERERCIDLMTKESMAEKRSQKEKLNSEQRVKDLIQRYQKATDVLINAYIDGNNEREKELRAIGGPNEFAEFYSRLKFLKDMHRRNPNETAQSLTIEFQEKINFLQDPDRVERENIRFTDEEGYGKYLDMHALFEQYLNLKGIKRIDYIAYITVFDHFFDISQDIKKTGAYKTYLTNLLNHLKDFLRRAKPLLDLDDELNACDKEFEQKYNEGKIPGWAKEKSQKMLTNPAVSLDLSQFNSVQELEVLGMDRLKSALISQNLKCGGTLQERAERLWKAKNQAITINEKAALKTGEDLKEEKRRRFLACTEMYIMSLTEHLRDERAATKENIERKQARSVDEDDDEDEVEEFVEEDDDDEAPYNPKNLPLGWDGKPIPYWLYKLHGLNIGYSCEICGNQVYKGPKTFQRHFTEWRHSHGMRCLGIPNTAHFTNITKINEAVELWKKICEEKKNIRWNPDIEEEFEDSLGNVVNRRTYEDLKRQGLL